VSGGRIAGLAPRFAAWRILHDVRHGVPFDVALHRSIKDLLPADKRLAHELAAGVFRSRTELDQALVGAIDRGLASVRADTLDVLRLGAFQLLRLDKVPPHAAVETAVGVGRRLGGQRVAGFVNAVLRRVASEGTSPSRPPVGDSEVATLANEYSHPEWLVERWLQTIGTEPTRARLAANNRRPRLVVQPNETTEAELTRLFAEHGITAEPAPWGAGLALPPGRPTELPGFRAGQWYVQDPAQRMVGRFLAPDPGSLVYDACAAPGGKTLAVAESTRFVVAADRQPARVRRLAENLARLRRTNVASLVADVLAAPLRAADAVVLDVPCLGTGTLGRNPDARWRVTPGALAGLVTQAAHFLSAAAEIVGPGGLLLFATCSLEPEEYEQQIDRFLDLDRRFRREPPPMISPDLLTEDGDLLVLPERHGTDGAYAARLRKAAP
jgi:16S rRNA (cytosine967-C5)-methyltransferase